jgi:hypothetical protein
VAGPFPCFRRQPLADVMDAANLSWKYYAPSMAADLGGSIWSAFDAIHSIRYGKDWANISSPETNIFDDISKGDSRRSAG